MELRRQLVCIFSQILVERCLTLFGREFGDYDAHFGIQTVNRTTQERRYKKSFFDLVDYMNARIVI